MKKGTITFGKSRTGKTFDDYKSFKNSTTPARKFVRADELYDIFQISNRLSEVKALARYNALWIDDFGHEAMNVSSFGSGPFNLLSELIKERYFISESNPETVYETYMNTNLTPSEIKSLYGEFIFNRIMALCPTLQKKENDPYGF